MRPKEHCNNCGILYRKHKLKKDKDRLICIRCFNKENKKSASQKNIKPLIPGGKDRAKPIRKKYGGGVFIRGEVEVLKKKYGYNKFKEGRIFNEIINLKKEIIKNRNSKVKTEEEKPKIDSKKFLEGLGQCKK